MGDEIYAEWENDERVSIIHFINDIGQPYNCTQWGNYGTSGIPPIVHDCTQYNNDQTTCNDTQGCHWDGMYCVHDAGEISNWFENPGGGRRLGL